jgi:hypothetical protein
MKSHISPEFYDRIPATYPDSNQMHLAGIVCDGNLV